MVSLLIGHSLQRRPFATISRLAVLFSEYGVAFVRSEFGQSPDLRQGLHCADLYFLCQYILMAL
jgi:hypothetical protein